MKRSDLHQGHGVGRAGTQSPNAGCRFQLRCPLCAGLRCHLPGSAQQQAELGIAIPLTDEETEAKKREKGRVDVHKQDSEPLFCCSQGYSEKPILK